MFEHQSDYSVALSPHTIESWWRSHIVFRIHARQSTHGPSGTSQRSGTPTRTLVGVARLSLRNVLKSRSFKLAKRLAIKEPIDSASQRIGTLHVSIELTSDAKEFTAGLARLRASESSVSRRRRSPAAPPLNPPILLPSTKRADQHQFVLAHTQPSQAPLNVTRPQQKPNGISSTTNRLVLFISIVIY